MGKINEKSIKIVGDLMWVIRAQSARYADQKKGSLWAQGYEEGRYLPVSQPPTVAFYLYEQGACKK